MICSCGVTISGGINAAEGIYKNSLEIYSMTKYFLEKIELTRRKR